MQELATIYRATEFMGQIVREEVKLIDCGTRQYAQYPRAAFVNYIPKGKRKPRGYVKGYQPYLLILKGHGHPDPDGLWVDLKPTTEGIVSLQKSRYLSFDERYKTDFDAKIEGYVKPEMVIMDYRNTVGTTVIPNKAA